MASQTRPSEASPRAGEPSRPKQGLEARSDGRARFLGCSKISAYEVLGKLGEGTFGEVHKAKSKKTSKFVALKKILMHHEKDGFPITALREIKLLKMLCHPNVLQLVEMAVEHRRDGRKKAAMYMVTPYMDHDLSGLLENPTVRITEPIIKCYMLQLLEGVRYLHSRQILHRDMKAANLLINNKGILQIADFGLARPFDEAPPVAGKGGGEASRDYTTLVVTRWYRPPELLLQLRRYTSAIDLWGVGCVFGEMFRGRPILAGKTDLNQMELICQLVGSPTEQNMPGWSVLPGCEGIKAFGSQKGNLHVAFREQGSAMISLMEQLLKLDWKKRINAIDALKHPYFTTPPYPAKPGELPQFEESHELDRRKFRDRQPPAPAGGTVGMGPNGGEWGAAHGNGQARRPPHGGAAGRRSPRHDHEGRFPHRNGGPPPDRRPQGWSSQQHQQRDLGLPPRPAKDANWSSWANEQTDKPRQRSAAPPQPASGIDTYIPNYDGSAERRARQPPPRQERNERGERGERVERAERSERGERGDRGDRGERNRGYDRERRRSRSPRY